MSKIIDFWKKSKLPILWTIGYVFTVWAILQILFNFDIFCIRDWIKASNAHLRGLGGLTFCMIIFAMVPLYIATTTIVIRTQKVLFEIPIPQFIKNFAKKLFHKPEPTPEPQQEKTESIDTQPTNEEIDKFPAEMRGVFIRARTRPSKITAPICSACSVNPNVYNNTETPRSFIPNDDLPLPPDFDISEDIETPITNSAPIFQDINFYDDDDDTEDNKNDNTNIINNPVTEHLGKTNRKFTVLPDDIILTDDKAIVIHDDSDFWIMDEPTWFASGKTRESPIAKLQEIAKEHNVTPVLYLGSNNIMNFTEKCKEWESAGIHIITKLEDL